MTPTALALRLLRHIGVISLASNANANSQNVPGLVDGDLDGVALAITGALHEIFADGPSSISDLPNSGILRSPTSVSLTATQYGTAISSFSSFASWMVGCTIRISGDGQDNEIVSQTDLLRPYMGSTGAQMATVYADAILLPDGVRNVMSPIWIPNHTPLYIANSPEQFQYWNSTDNCNRSAWYGIWAGSYYYTQNKSVGEPCVCMVDSRYDSTVGPMKVFLRFNPMPGGPYAVTFRSKMKPPTITAADLYSEFADSVTITGTLSPNITGVYQRIGLLHGYPLYFLNVSGTTYALWFNDDASWVLSAASGIDGYGNAWAMGSTSVDPSGVYTASGAYTGTATVTASAPPATGLVIPTDWHESILYPMALQRFTSHPGFAKDANQLREISRQYDEAKRLLQSFHPPITAMHGQFR